VSYGVEIVNEDGRIIIDDKVSNLYCPYPEVAGGNSYPPPNYTNGDLVLARPFTTNSSLTEGGLAGCFYNIIRPIAGNVTGSTNYGFEVRNSAGDLTYISDASNIDATLIVYGSLLFGSGTVTFTDLYPMEELYVSIDNTDNLVQFGPNRVLGYDYNYEERSIRPFRSGVFLSTPDGNAATNFDYSIWRVRGL
jgi:hypothetical protein